MVRTGLLGRGSTDRRERVKASSESGGISVDNGALYMGVGREVLLGSSGGSDSSGGSSGEEEECGGELHDG